jgi:hypothetical protein
MYDFQTFAWMGELSGFKSANGMCVDDAQKVAEEPEKTFDDSTGLGSGEPVTYTPSNICNDDSPAYDDSGNLFVAGAGTSGPSAMAELPSGQTLTRSHNAS